MQFLILEENKMKTMLTCIALLLFPYIGMAQVEVDEIGKGEFNNPDSVYVGKIETQINVTNNYMDYAAMEKIVYRAVSDAKREDLMGVIAYFVDKLRQTNISNERERFKYETIISALTAKKNSYNYLPFGVNQFVNNETGKGILFAGVEAGLLGAGIGYRISSKHNLEKHKDNSYDPWERDRFYDKYKSQRRTAGWYFAGTAVAIGLNYCDNFMWFRKNNIRTAAIPTVDMHGNLQTTFALSMKF